MATINGVDITTISSYNGKPLSSISAISGLQTSNIPGWPHNTPSCVTLSLGYQSGPPIATVCNQDLNDYNYDTNTKLLYNFGSCGTELAPLGFYSDGSQIFDWNGETFNKIGSCATYPRFSNLVDVVEDATSYPFISVQYSNQQNGISGEFRFNYSAYTGLELYCKVSTSLEYPYDGDYSTLPPKFMEPPFIFVEAAGSTFETIINVPAGSYISLGYTSFNVPPNVTMTVGVEVKIDRDTWIQIGSFDCTNVLSL